MSWTMRIATAAVLAVAIAGLPLMLDRCAAACEAHREAVAGTPSCHHASSPAAHLGHMPGPCNHDHTATVGAASGGAVPLRAFDALVAEVAVPVPLADARVSWLHATHAPPGSATALHAGSLPLRI